MASYMSITITADEIIMRESYITGPMEVVIPHHQTTQHPLVRAAIQTYGAPRHGQELATVIAAVMHQCECWDADDTDGEVLCRGVSAAECAEAIAQHGGASTIVPRVC